MKFIFYLALTLLLSALYSCEEKIEDPSSINLSAIKRAILWSDYLKSHARRIYGWQIVGTGTK